MPLEEARMSGDRMDRKAFIATLGRVGVGTCMCGAALAMEQAFGAEASPKAKAGEKKAAVPASQPETKPGDKSAARAAKRMEFVDAWVPRLFKVMDGELDETTRRRLMAANGKACYCAFRPDQKPRSEPATRERITEWVATRGKDEGYRMEGDVITTEFTSSAETGKDSPEHICLCPAAESQSAKTISPTFCWCSVGYVKEMHERVFGRPVNVELVESVLLGQPRCK